MGCCNTVHGFGIRAAKKCDGLCSSRGTAERMSLFLQPVYEPVPKAETPVCSRPQGMEAEKVTV